MPHADPDTRLAYDRARDTRKATVRLSAAELDDLDTLAHMLRATRPAVLRAGLKIIALTLADGDTLVTDDDVRVMIDRDSAGAKDA